MSEFQTVAKVGSLTEGQGTTIEVGDKLIALFLHGGQYYAIDDSCPHQGASLGAGYLDEEGAVSCPWHAWRFSVCDGTWCDKDVYKRQEFRSTKLETPCLRLKQPSTA